MNADPASRERQRAAVAAHFDKPGAREASAARLTSFIKNMPAEHREWLRQRGHRVWRDHLQSPEAVAKWKAGRVEAGAKRSATVLAWCPPELRDHYRYLKNTKLYKAAEARAIIEEMIPGTKAHGRREVLNNRDAMRLKHEREKASRY